LHDLKKCINDVHTNQSLTKQDFSTVQAYENWQKREVKQLTELMNSLMLMNPKLSIVDTSRNCTDNFTFIPNEPKAHFQALMKLCLDHDTENFATIPEIERAKTSALSQQSIELLRECWKTWRLSSPYRAILYLSLTKQKLDQNELGISDIFDAFRSLDKVTKENELTSWAISEVNSHQLPTKN
jgi:hypothetical protein